MFFRYGGENSVFFPVFLISRTYGILCPGPLYLRTNHVMCPWAWRNWLSVGTTSSRFAAPPILPSPVWYTVPRAFIFEDKPYDVSLGLEPSLRAGSLYANSIIRVGRNASAFLGNAAGKHRLRTAWGSVHGIINKRQQRLRNLLFTGEEGRR